MIMAELEFTVLVPARMPGLNLLFLVRNILVFLFSSCLLLIHIHCNFSTELSRLTPPYGAVSGITRHW